MSDNTPLTPLTPDENDPGGALDRRGIARAASLIMLALILSGILGIVRQAVIAAAFGAGYELDAFYAALRVPETLFTLVAGGALGSAFIPVFARFLAQDDFSGAWRLASAVLTLVVLGGTLVSLGAFVLAESLVAYILIPGADAQSQTLTVELMRLMLVTVVIFGASGLSMGILNSYQHFLAPALAPSLYNVGLIIGALALAPAMGIQGLAWGAVIGAGLHLLIQLPFLWKLEHRALQPSLGRNIPAVREVLSLMGPRVLGLGIVQVNFWVNAALTSNMAEGSLSALTIAFTLMFTVLGILGQSVGTAVFPTLARLHAEGKNAAFSDTFNQALKSVLFLSIPAGFGLAALATPIVAVLFERGEWSARDTEATAWALLFFGVGLAGHAALEILARAFYALHDTWTPVSIGGLTMLLNIGLSLFFVAVYPDEVDFERGAFGLLALSMSIATALESTVLYLLLRRRTGLQGRTLLDYLVRVVGAALLMAGAVIGWQAVGEGLPTLILLIGGVSIGGAVFFGLALLLRVEEARAIPQAVLSRLGR